MIPTITRIALGCLLVYAVFTETGPWTAVFASLMLAFTEAENLGVLLARRKIERTVDDVLAGRTKAGRTKAEAKP